METFCADTTIIVNGVTYNESNPMGMEFVPDGGPNGCGQNVFIDLLFEQSSSSDIQEELCVGESRVINGTTYDVNNPTGQEILIANNGCDSLLNIDLNFKGLQVNIEPVSPFCASKGGGYLAIEIVNGQEDLIDILLDGISFLQEFLINDTIFNIEFGNHTIAFLDADGCDYSEDFVLELMDDINLNLTATIIEGEGYYLDFDYNGDLESIEWTPIDGLSCNTCPNPIANPEMNTTYTVMIQDVNGCSYTDSIALDYLFLDVYYRPTVFSPNDDGVNDFFYIDSFEPTAFSNFDIYDRWGNKVYSYANGMTGDPDFGWNGKYQNNKAQQGVYVYYITLELPNGPQKIFGDVTLMR
jgi:gliding motility-associated-like protein